MYRKLLSAPLELPPKPWKKTIELTRESVLGVGFTRDEMYLLTLTWEGRELYDCKTGKCLAIDETPFDAGGAWWSEYDCSVRGIGEAKDDWICMACIYGGGLHRSTEDDWRISSVNLYWPETDVLLMPPNVNTIDEAVKIYQPYATLVAFGFSHGGHHLALAARDQMMLFTRD